MKKIFQSYCEEDRKVERLIEEPFLDDPFFDLLLFYLTAFNKPMRELL